MIFFQSVSTISIKRCCPENHIWNSKLNQCDQGDDSSLGTLINIQLDDSANINLPCDNRDRETFKLGSEGNSVSAKGHLVTSKYGPLNLANITQFCLGASDHGDLIAVTCNFCLETKVSPQIARKIIWKA